MEFHEIDKKWQAHAIFFIIGVFVVNKFLEKQATENLQMISSFFTENL